MKGTSYKRIKAMKVFHDILKYLSDQNEPVSGAEIAEAIGVPVGTLRDHLATMEDYGTVVKINGKYKVGMFLAKVWSRVKANLESECREARLKLKNIDIKEA